MPFFRKKANMVGRDQALGGRAEPISGELESSTAQIVTGEDYVAGLARGG